MRKEQIEMKLKWVNQTIASSQQELNSSLNYDNLNELCLAYDHRNRLLESIKRNGEILTHLSVSLLREKNDLKKVSLLQERFLKKEKTFQKKRESKLMQDFILLRHYDKT
ncbi:MAG: hypothetical protein NZO16_00420 [Deltaproteobacteria bacterium]|nr:hypothetical protein [Deltaproteobacteria bacterium]